MTSETPRNLPATLPPLNLDLNVAATKAELAVIAPVDKNAAKAKELATQLMAVDPEDGSSRESNRQAVETMGRALQSKAAQKSKMLQAPIKELARGAEDGGQVARALVDLKIQVERLDPVSLDLEPGWVSRLVGAIPGVGTQFKRYFSKFEKSQTVIDAIIKSLEKGREQLRRDNVTLGEDQSDMRDLTKSLSEQVGLAIALDQAIQAELQRSVDDEKKAFIEEELVFSLRQRTMDLQQQLAVNQQGVLALEILTRNNRELIRGVDRAIDVTVGALQVAVTVALGLAHQKIVLDKIDAINQTTSQLIAGTAERLRSQGAEIHAQASSAMLDLGALKSAFANINAALDEISQYRRQALPAMAGTILELDQLTKQSEESISKMEAAREVADKMRLDISGPDQEDEQE